MYLFLYKKVHSLFKYCFSFFSLPILKDLNDLSEKLDNLRYRASKGKVKVEKWQFRREMKT